MSSRLLAACCSAGLALTLTGCMQMPPATSQEPPRVLAFPAPPEEARFVYERTIRSSLDVIPAEETSALRRLVTGEKDRGEGLSKPSAVAVQEMDVHSRYRRHTRMD